MALIKCPECGRENVSDSAEMCPACGYGIKAHFKQLEEDRVKAKIEEEFKQECKRQQELTQKVIDANAQNIDLPTTRPFMNGWLLFSLFWMVLLVLFLLVQMKIIGDGSNAILWIVFSLFFFIITYSYGRSKLINERELYDKYKYQPEEYKRQLAKLRGITQMEYKEINQKLVEERKDLPELQKEIDKIKQNKHIIRCPICGSADVKKISTASRATSVAMFGLASSKIGKQYECKNCKHKW